MSSEHIYDEFRFEIQPALRSKLEEFQLLGYATISEDDLWKYLTQKKWKRSSGDRRIFELVQDVLHVKISEYMNFATIEAFKLDNFFTELTEEEKRELLK
ncbi:post-transcriptional regulator [Niallia nealsonii]|uniref:Post-transcriptional regulator n=1 Tax=Niallia nealsonii TaxID=115979 RepID=A0A2N0Z4K0_9BACI|nr:post-transcriptional regulator [Niallia nealsonii]PKG24430.1 post-transcriptional regulator [Niallia nealsonii]